MTDREDADQDGSLLIGEQSATEPEIGWVESDPRVAQRLAPESEVVRIEQPPNDPPAGGADERSATSDTPRVTRLDEATD